jgi:hypothetical protein
MRKVRQASERQRSCGEVPWRFAVAHADVSETGLHVDLAADEKARCKVASLAGLEALPRLEASFDITRHGASGLRVVGRVSATVGQICGVTLEPTENEVNEDVDLVFVPASHPSRGHDWSKADTPFADVPEELVDGAVDLGALATEFLILGIDPYPRKLGAAFEPPSTDSDVAQPFAVLDGLVKGRSRKDA